MQEKTRNYDWGSQSMETDEKPMPNKWDKGFNHKDDRQCQKDGK